MGIKAVAGPNVPPVMGVMVGCVVGPGVMVIPVGVSVCVATRGVRCPAVMSSANPKQ